MKKSIVVLVFAVSLLAILLVAFTGATYAVIDNTTVYVNKIVLDTKTLKNPSNSSKNIYTVLERETYLAENPEKASDFQQEGNSWYDYIIKIVDYNYFFDYLGNSLKLEAHVLPTEATNKALRYHGRAKDEIYATVSREGEVAFQSKLEEIAEIQVTIEAQDGSGTSCSLKIQSRMYIE